MSFVIDRRTSINAAAIGAWYDESATLHLVRENNGKLMHYAEHFPLGDLPSSLDIEIGTQLASDRDVTDFRATSYPNRKVWFTWIRDSALGREAIWEDEPTTSEAKSPYKLYYAVDTERLFMNIDDYWEFIGSPNINRLLDAGLNAPGGGGDNPNSYAATISTLLGRIEALEAAIGQD